MFILSQVLPAVICFVKGVVTDRIIGFDELGEDGSDDFPTESLERRLAQSGVLLAGGNSSGGGGKNKGSILGRPSTQKNDDSDEDNDW